MRAYLSQHVRLKKRTAERFYKISPLGSKRDRTWKPLGEYNVASNSTRETFSLQFSAIGTGLLRKHVPMCTSCVLVLKLFQVFLWNYRYFPISRLHRLAFREEINVTVSFRLAEQSKSAEGERYCLLWPSWGTRKHKYESVPLIGNYNSFPF